MLLLIIISDNLEMKIHITYNLINIFLKFRDDLNQFIVSPTSSLGYCSFDKTYASKANCDHNKVF
jgi:hypothetical protein